MTLTYGLPLAQSEQPFSDSVRLWCADRGADDPDPFAAKDLVEEAGVLAMPRVVVF